MTDITEEPTDDSDGPITVPFPPSDPHLWDRDEYWATVPFEAPAQRRRPRAFRPDLEEQDA